jgi:hypothetical protein
MKKAVLSFVLMMVSAVALAIPSPKQIEDAMAAQKYADAKSMVQEVLREKPDSARAHLLNAFLLIHVDHNKVAANSELQTAAGLDKKGDVKSSPLFGRVVAELDMQPTKTALRPRASGADVADFFFTVVLILLAGGAIVAVIAAFRERETIVHVHGGGIGSAGGSTYTPPAAGPSSGGAYYPHATTTIVQNPANPAMGAFGTAAAVAGGVVAGEVLADSLLHRHRSYRNDDYEDRSRRESPSSSYTPDSSPVSYESERSSFSSSSSSSDSWGSSDSSSSFSSDSGSSSWD